MPALSAKALLNILSLVTICIGGGIIFLMITIMGMNAIAPGKILIFAGTFTLIAVAQMLWAFFGMVALKINKHELITMYYIGLYIVVLFDVGFGMEPLVVFSWSTRSLKEYFQYNDRRYFFNMERYYGCCGLNSYKDYWEIEMYHIPPSCCGDALCDVVKNDIFKKKPGCLEVVPGMASMYMLVTLLIYGSVIVQILSIIKTFKYIKQNTEYE